MCTVVSPVPKILFSSQQSYPWTCDLLGFNEYRYLVWEGPWNDFPTSLIQVTAQSEVHQQHGGTADWVGSWNLNIVTHCSQAGVGPLKQRTGSVLSFHGNRTCCLYSATSFQVVKLNMDSLWIRADSHGMETPEWDFGLCTPTAKYSYSVSMFPYKHQNSLGLFVFLLYDKECSDWC